jgi:hypothetical protein
MTDRPLPDEVVLASVHNSPEIYALVEALSRILKYADPAECEMEIARLIVYYDHFRSQQIESLKERLIDALRWSVKPTQAGGEAPLR